MKEQTEAPRNTILLGDALEQMRTIPTGCAQAVITSPPYYWVRDYDVAGQYGHEATPAAFIAHLAAVFAEAKRVLRPDGVLYVNIGDTYYSGKGQPQGHDARSTSRNFSRRILRAVDQSGWDIPQKSLIGIPYMLAFALQAQGWVWRSNITWYRENAMPESGVKDRPHRQQESVLLFAKSRRYYFNRLALGGDEDVWCIPVTHDVRDHSATFPLALAERCITTGSRRGDLVVDPFMGLGTVGVMAQRLGRDWLGCEIKREYRDMALDRIARDQLPEALKKTDLSMLHSLFEMDA